MTEDEYATFTVRAWRRDSVKLIEQEIVTYKGEFATLHAAKVFAEALQERLSCFRIQIQLENKAIVEYVAYRHENNKIRPGQVVNIHHWKWRETTHPAKGMKPVTQFGDISMFSTNVYSEICTCKA